MKKLCRGVCGLVIAVSLTAGARAGENEGSLESLRARMEEAQALAAIQADKAGFVRQLLDRWAGAAAERGYDAYAEKGARRLGKRSPQELLALSRVDSWEKFDRVTFRGATIDALGNITSDLVFNPLPACRLLDTRIGTGLFLGPLAPGTQMSFSVNDTLGPQGGNAAGCGVTGVGDDDPPALAIVITAASPAGGAGNLRTFATGDPVPTASVLTYTAGTTISTAAITESCVGCGPELTVRNQGGGTTHVVVDVAGTFTQPSGYGTNNGTIWAGAHITSGVSPTVTRSFNNFPGSPAVTVIRLGAGQYEVGFGADVSGRYYHVTVGTAVAGNAANAFGLVSPRSGNVNALFIEIVQHDNVLIDEDFFVSVY